MAKLLGYLISLIGLAGLALTFEPVKQIVNVPLPEQITPTILTIGSVIVIVIGLFLVSRSSSKRSPGRQREHEVPIYHGKEIVGYRKH